MAHIHKGQLTLAPPYAAFWKHLREWKRAFRKRERKAARLAAARDANDA